MFLEVTFENFLQFFKEFANDNRILIIIVSIFLPFLEAIVPMLPLVGIVSFNMASLGSIYGGTIGSVLGVVLSIAGSSIGMFLIFILIRDLIGKKYREKIKSREKILHAVEWIENRSNTFMILFLSNPYIPTSIFNYAMALTGYSIKKYLIITIISRIICVSLLSILGMIFDVSNDIKSIVWICLTYVVIYFIIWIVKKVVIKKENENEKNY